MKKNQKIVLFLIIIALMLQVIVLGYSRNFALVISLLVILNIVLIGIWWREKQRMQLSQDEIVKQTTQTVEESIEYVSQEMPVGILVWKKDKVIEWLNPYAEEILDTPEIQTQFLESLFFAQAEGKSTITVGEQIFRFSINKQLKIIYFTDITHSIRLAENEKNRQTGIGIISIDNYGEAIDQMDDKEISYLNSFITSMVADWMQEYQVFYKRITAERFFFVARLEDIQKMSKKQFNLLDRLRNEAEKSGIPITVSMGIAYGRKSLENIGELAQNNLEIALVRGGDQVVLKEAVDNSHPVYYGGKSNSVMKRTRVRSRAMSTALNRIFDQTGDVFIMGHRFPDMDAIGAAFGVACLARFHGKKTWIIIDEHEIIPDVERCIQEIAKYPELYQLVVTPEEAKKLVEKDSLLMMVDYHRPSLSISQEVYEKFTNIVIIDHHRRGDEFPESPLLTYIESSASSTSELITELIQYQSNAQNKLQKFEATLLLAGMVVDTKSFSVRTSAKTFDAASYLRTCGADSSLVQYLLSSDLESYLEMSQLIALSQYITEDLVIASGTEDKQYDSVTAAKTADMLLSMNGINAAFVVTRRTDGLVGINARSSGVINVQLIMEALGGGGHFTNAATQLPNITIAEAVQELLKVIERNTKEMYEKESNTK